MMYLDMADHGRSQIPVYLQSSHMHRFISNPPIFFFLGGKPENHIHADKCMHVHRM